jgi:hypothetical protein
MNSPSPFEPADQTHSTTSRNPFIPNHFPIPKTAHHRNSRKTNTLAHSSQKHGGYGVSVPNRESGIGNRKIYFEGLGSAAGSFAPSRSTRTWFNFALIWPRSCAFVM